MQRSGLFRLQTAPFSHSKALACDCKNHLRFEKRSKICRYFIELHAFEIIQQQNPENLWDTSSDSPILLYTCHSNFISQVSNLISQASTVLDMCTGNIKTYIAWQRVGISSFNKKSLKLIFAMMLRIVCQWQCQWHVISPEFWLLVQWMRNTTPSGDFRGSHVSM